jgi:hypothetical protein
MIEMHYSSQSAKIAEKFLFLSVGERPTNANPQALRVGWHIK